MRRTGMPRPAEGFAKVYPNLELHRKVGIRLKDET